MEGWIVIPSDDAPVKKVINIDKYKTFFNSVEHWPDSIIIDVCSTVTNVKKMVETHILVIENTASEKLFQPYYDRLLTIYNKMQPIIK